MTILSLLLWKNIGTESEIKVMVEKNKGLSQEILSLPTKLTRRETARSHLALFIIKTNDAWLKYLLCSTIYYILTMAQVEK